MKNETEVVKIRIDSDVKTELEKIAEQEQRTFSGQVRLALAEWIKSRKKKSPRLNQGSAGEHHATAKGMPPEEPAASV